MCLTWAWSSLSCGALCCVKLNWGGWEELKCLHISIESLLLVLTTHPIYQKVTKEILQSKRLPSANGTSVNNNRSLLNSSVNEDKKSEWWSPLCNWTFFVFPQSARWRGQIETEQKQLKIVFSAFKSFFPAVMFQKVLHILLVCTDTEKPKKEPLRFKVSLSDAAVVLWGVRTAPVFFSSSSCTVTVICIYNLSTHMCFSDFCVVKGITMMMMIVMMIIACAKTKYTLEDLFCVNEPCLHLTINCEFIYKTLFVFPP